MISTGTASSCAYAQSLRLSQTRVYTNTVTTQSKLCDTIEINGLTVIFTFFKFNLEPKLKWNFSREITMENSETVQNHRVFAIFLRVLNFSREKIEIEIRTSFHDFLMF